jgi:hypothetical protein
VACDNGLSLRWFSTGKAQRVVPGVLAVFMVGWCSACGGSPSSGTAPESKSASSSPACALVSAPQVAKIVGSSSVAVPTKANLADDSSCLWHASASSPGLDIYLDRNSSAVHAFRASVAQPPLSVMKISIDGSEALLRPPSDADGGVAFVSAATNDALVSVEATGDMSGLDSAAEAMAKIALTYLRSHPS